MHKPRVSGTTSRCWRVEPWWRGCLGQRAGLIGNTSFQRKKAQHKHTRVGVRHMLSGVKGLIEMENPGNLKDGRKNPKASHSFTHSGADWNLALLTSANMVNKNDIDDRIVAWGFEANLGSLCGSGLVRHERNSRQIRRHLVGNWHAPRDCGGDGDYITLGQLWHTKQWLIKEVLDRRRPTDMPSFASELLAGHSCNLGKELKSYRSNIDGFRHNKLAGLVAMPDRDAEAWGECTDGIRNSGDLPPSRDKHNGRVLGMKLGFGDADGNRRKAGVFGSAKSDQSGLEGNDGMCWCDRVTNSSESFTQIKRQEQLVNTPEEARPFLRAEEGNLVSQPSKLRVDPSCRGQMLNIDGMLIPIAGAQGGEGFADTGNAGLDGIPFVESGA